MVSRTPGKAPLTRNTILVNLEQHLNRPRESTCIINRRRTEAIFTENLSAGMVAVIGRKVMEGSQSSGHTHSHSHSLSAFLCDFKV